MSDIGSALIMSMAISKPQVCKNDRDARYVRCAALRTAHLMLMPRQQWRQPRRLLKQPPEKVGEANDDCPASDRQHHGNDDSPAAMAKEIGHRLMRRVARGRPERSARVPQARRLNVRRYIAHPSGWVCASPFCRVTLSCPDAIATRVARNCCGKKREISRSNVADKPLVAFI